MQPVMMPSWAMGGVLVAVAVDAASAMMQQQYEFSSGGGWGFVAVQPHSCDVVATPVAEPGVALPAAASVGLQPGPSAQVIAPTADLDSTTAAEVATAPAMPSLAAGVVETADDGQGASAKIFIHRSDGALRYVASAKGQAGRCDLEVPAAVAAAAAVAAKGPVGRCDREASIPQGSMQHDGPSGRRNLPMRSLAAPLKSCLKTVPHRSDPKAATALSQGPPSRCAVARTIVQSPAQLEAWRKVLPAPRKAKGGGTGLAGGCEIPAKSLGRAAKGGAVAPTGGRGGDDQRRKAAHAGGSLPSAELPQAGSVQLLSPPQSRQAAECTAEAEAAAGESSSTGPGAGSSRCSARGARGKARGGKAAKSPAKQEETQEREVPLPANICADSSRRRSCADTERWREALSPVVRIVRGVRSKLLVAAASVAELSAVSPRGVLAGLLLLVAIVTCTLVVAAVLVLQSQLPVNALGQISEPQDPGAMGLGIDPCASGASQWATCVGAGTQAQQSPTS